MNIKPLEPKITVVLLNYKRPQNIPLILKAIRRQTVPANIFLWNNGIEDVNSSMVDRYERSERNVGCMARWKMVREAKTSYVMSLDDDICLNKDDVLERIILSLNGQDKPNRIIGFYGARFTFIPSYTIKTEIMCRSYDEKGKARGIGDTYEIGTGGRPIYAKRKFAIREEAVDVVYGRTMAFRKDLLDDIILPEEREDDIFLSAVFARKARRVHRIPSILNDAFYNLPDLGVGNRHKEEHLLSRERALRTYFYKGKIGDNGIIRYIFVTLYKVKILIIKISRQIKH